MNKDLQETAKKFKELTGFEKGDIISLNGIMGTVSKFMSFKGTIQIGIYWHQGQKHDLYFWNDFRESKVNTKPIEI